ncbi:MAG: hypothetical protein C0605_16185 [Hyphomicrobiales bacterium]|nr:MAG: hypothetical protein C0605_16185 [Hyphomicrobiales bacterium]
MTNKDSKPENDEIPAAIALDDDELDQVQGAGGLAGLAGAIANDPGGFAGNLAGAVTKGAGKFAENTGEHAAKGLQESGQEKAGELADKAGGLAQKAWENTPAGWLLSGGEEDGEQD